MSNTPCVFCYERPNYRHDCDAVNKAYDQMDQYDPETLAERVEALPAGTIFRETDDLGHSRTLLKTFTGCLFDNGINATPFVWGDTYEEGWSIEVISVPTYLVPQSKDLPLL